MISLDIDIMSNLSVYFFHYTTNKILNGVCGWGLLTKENYILSLIIDKTRDIQMLSYVKDDNEKLYSVFPSKMYYIV